MSDEIQPFMTHGRIKERAVDLKLIIGIFLMAILVAVTAELDPHYYRLVDLANLWLLGYHHVIATFTKLAGTVSDRRRNSALLWILLPAIMLITFALGYTCGVTAIVTVYFFWHWFHYVRQSWGIAQRYRHRYGKMKWDEERLSELTLWSVPVWGLLNRCYQNPDTFLTMPVWMPHVPFWLVQLMSFVSACLVGWWVLSRIRAWQRNELEWVPTFYMLSHFVLFAFGYVFIDNVSAGWLLVTVWHNTQYIVFVRMHHCRRFSGVHAEEGTVMPWLSQTGVIRATLYYGFCLLISTSFYYALANSYVLADKVINLSGGVLNLTPINYLILLSMGINFHHYIVDGIVWKRKYEVRAVGAASSR